jgi:hypothetical protein
MPKVVCNTCGEKPSATARQISTTGESLRRPDSFSETVPHSKPAELGLTSGLPRVMEGPFRFVSASYVCKGKGKRSGRKAGCACPRLMDADAGRHPVCTENLIRVDEAMESPKLAE